MSALVQLSRVAKLSARIGWHGLSTDDHLDDGEYLVTGTDFADGRVDWSQAKKVSFENWERDRNIQLEAGDLLVSKDGTIGKVALVDSLPGRATLNSGLFRVRTSDQVLPRFLYWVLQSAVFAEFVGHLGAGSTIKHLYQRDFEKFRFPLPELDEQRRIADYLDEQTSVIGAARSAISAELSLLEVRDVEVCRRYTTVGLESSPSLARTPVSWMPFVHQSWPLRRVGHIARLGSGTTPPSGRPDYYDGPVPWVQSGDLNDGAVSRTRKTVSALAVETIPALRVHEAGSLVVAMYGATVGRLGVLDTNAAVNQACCVMDIDRELMNVDFVFAWFLGHRPEIVRLAQGGGQPNISQDVIRNLRVPGAGLGEQDRIVRALRSEREMISRLAQRFRALSTVIEERRASIISAAVTGQLEAATARKVA